MPVPLQVDHPLSKEELICVPRLMSATVLPLDLLFAPLVELLLAQQVHHHFLRHLGHLTLRLVALDVHVLGYYGHQHGLLLIEGAHEVIGDHLQVGVAGPGLPQLPVDVDRLLAYGRWVLRWFPRGSCCSDILRVRHLPS